MDRLRSQISMQMQRFLMIQNSMEDATEEFSTHTSRHLIGTRLEILENNWAKFQTEHEKICMTEEKRLEEEAYIKHRTYERCQEFFVQAKASLLKQQDLIEASHSSSRSSETMPSEKHSIDHRRALPRIDLPKFSGNYHDWRSFHDLFMSMVGDNEYISNVEKMYYLKTCLSGDAARIVTNVKITDDTFARAWQTLVSRFENKRVLISAQLDNLFNLKPIRPKSARDLNSMLTTVTETLGALQALGCATDAWDPLLIHQLVRLLDEETREAWEIKLGTSTTYPTFKHFEEFVIGHTRAWESLASVVVSSSKEKRRASWPAGKHEFKARSLMATTKGDVECDLCKSSHHLYACPAYLLQPVERRKRTIVKLKLCFNCFGNHTANNCPSTRRCKKCGKRHHTTIHEDFHNRSKTSGKTDFNKLNPSTVNLPPINLESK